MCSRKPNEWVNVRMTFFPIHIFTWLFPVPFCLSSPMTAINARHLQITSWSFIITVFLHIIVEGKEQNKNKKAKNSCAVQTFATDFARNKCVEFKSIAPCKAQYNYLWMSGSFYSVCCNCNPKLERGEKKCDNFLFIVYFLKRVSFTLFKNLNLYYS